MESGILTKVLNDFYTTVEGELSLSKGEYFLIHNVIDKHWCYGVSKDRWGSFPCNYLLRVEVPQFKEAESLFVSIASFRGEQQGDLIFGEGELIIGTHEVEPGWYSGYIDNRTGVFPLTHVWIVDLTVLKKPSDKKSVRRKARVKTTLKAQLEEELDLSEGEIVTVTEILEDGWVLGYTSDNRTGTFPEAFITYLETMDQPDNASGSLDPIPQSITSGGKIYKDFGDSTPSCSYSEDAAPSYYDLFPDTRPSDNSQPPTVSFPSTNPKGSSPQPELDNLNPLGVHPYAITLYPFNAQFPNELNFEAGEVVHLLRHIDTEWAEGTIETSKGLFPTSYVNIIVDCRNSPPPEAPKEDAEHLPLESLHPGDLATVEYTFNAQMSGDLSIKEGDSVTIVEMANDDWVSVKNTSGEVGLCPRGYLSKQPSSQASLELCEAVVIRHERSKTPEEQNIRRKSDPHRPAPPAPAPGSVPLQKSLANNQEKNQTSNQEENETISTSSPEPSSSKQKRADKRQNVISELVITEKEYVRDLKVTYETFNLYNPSLLETRGIDVVILFGNILEVIHVAEELLDAILRAMKGKDENVQTIAPCFLVMRDKLQTTYGKYCGNHEAALSLLKKYEENREIMIVFEKGIETLRHQVVCFDMSSILIKPVQRILKYPLMLYELVKCTEDDHPDKQGIEQAWKVMTEVASYINEYKRRKDIVSKYLDTDNTLMAKMSKLSMHSVAKKSSRLSAKLSASLGITNIPADPVFEELERQFKALEKCSWQFATDINHCMYYLNEETDCAELLSDFLNQYHYGSNDNEVKRLSEARKSISSQFINSLKETIEKRVNEPVACLINLLEGPALLITKRGDKLLDYDNAISKGEKYRESRAVQEELADARNNYEALNQQLLEELPIFIEAGTSIIATCIEAFANARKLFSGRITKKYLTLSESATQVTPQDLLQSFLINHNLLWNQISRFSFAGVNPKVECPTVEVSNQNEKDKKTLMGKYHRNSLFVVKDKVVSTSSFDLGAARGTVVAVIKRQDPMGDTTRWLVDNGSVKGFIHNSSLEPIPQPRSPQNNNDVADYGNVPGDLMSLDSPVKEIKENLISLDSPIKQSSSSISLQNSLYENLGDDNENQRVGVQQSRYQNLGKEFYYAEFNFEGGIPGTLPAKRGRVLKLIRPHDEKGNGEWWLMEDRDGCSGYFPKNYLLPLESNKS
ncbi:dynamin-binding protein-like [Fopius arisanus]|uniref:Dynamin-binding protein n=1 Tax=Fopius arisanus TaxID=64838 RepID=A0A0C9QQJ5_9HYME|nr:PREDICTED: dynamin-binding protein-like [Fopius arisanus]